MPDFYRRFTSLLVALAATAAVVLGIEAAPHTNTPEVSDMSKKNPIVQCGVNVDGVEWFGTVDETDGSVVVNRNAEEFARGKWDDGAIDVAKVPPKVAKALSEGLAAQARAQ